MLRVFKIQGDSLYPLYKDKQIVLALSTSFCTLKTGDVVVFKQKQGLLTKQIDHIKNEQFYLLGKSYDSVDSRIFGYINKKDIKYKILCAII